LKPSEPPHQCANAKRRLALQGILLLALLAAIQAESAHTLPLIIKILREEAWLPAAFAIFSHNILAAAVVVYCMHSCAVVSSLLLERRTGSRRYFFASLIFNHPGAAAAFTASAIALASMIRGAFLGHAALQDLPGLFAFSLPVLFLEGYGLYLCIRDALLRTVRIKNIFFASAVFFAAAVVEVLLISLL